MEHRIPVIEERARVDKEVVERGVVRISASSRDSEQVLEEALRHEEVDIHRVTLNEEVGGMPEIRQEGDAIIIPIVEERAVIVKKLVLVEELYVRRRKIEEIVRIPVTLRSTEVLVERERSPTGGEK